MIFDFNILIGMGSCVYVFISNKNKNKNTNMYSSSELSELNYRFNWAQDSVALVARSA
jgi:hypothetical protein